MLHFYPQTPHLACWAETFNTLHSASTPHPQQLRWLSWKPIQKLPLLRWDSATKLLLTQCSHTRACMHTRTHTHAPGGLTQGSPTRILRQETDSPRIAPPPPHLISLDIHTNTRELHSTLSPSLAEPQSVVDCRNSQGVIWLCLHKHAESKGRRKRRERVRNSKRRLKKRTCKQEERPWADFGEIIST